MVGDIINNYLIDEIIDDGGMSTVYLGIHKQLKRKAAIKMLKPNLAKNPQSKERFRQEAITLSKLNHPNITALYDYVENQQGLFIISEFVKGQPLDDYIDLVTGPMPETKAVKIFTQILSAISYIHSKNIIHRDIKPSNILITPNGNVKLIDFGIAKYINNNTNVHTKDGSKVGTTMFMSPQQIKGRVLDRRSDIYSLGATLFYILTGQLPYDKNLTEYEIYNKILNEPFPNPKEFYKGVSLKMCEIIEKATAEKPLDRFQTCEEFNINIQISQTKISKPKNISLQTKIIEESDLEIKNKIFSRTFLQNMILMIAAIIFTTAIGTGIFFLNKKDIRRVIAPQGLLLAADSANAELIEKINYGETVRILRSVKSKTSDSLEWFRVASLRNNSGYIKKTDLAVNHIFDQINEIMGNTYSGQLTPTKYKIAIRDYFLENRLFEDNKTKWKLFAEQKNDFEYNTISFGYFDNSDEENFACILTKINSDEKKMIIFLNNAKQNVIIDLNGDFKIKTISKGKSGGRWFIGNTTSRLTPEGKSYDAKKYEYLEIDAISVLNTKTNESVLYIYNPEMKNVNFFAQPN